MKSLLNDEDKTELLQRLENLTPESKARWGRMTVNQMLCHLSDSFILLRKDNIPTKPPSTLQKIRQKTMIWFALHSGLPAPRGIPTAAAVDQEKGGTSPIGFEEDKQTVIIEMHNYADNNRSYEHCYHPIFGYLTPEEWQGFGYMHVDHHFKQFGV